jgi:(p)ppGpp synthase/HD superfamily hydrolase
MPDNPKSILTSRFVDALSFAADVHRSQVRKGTRIPYLAHLLGVASIALEHGATEDEAIAAVLHDSIEDAPTDLGASPAQTVRDYIRYRFGDTVLDIVEACTDGDVQPKPAWRQRKERYIRDIAEKDASALLVSLADKIHNARAILSDFREVDASVFERFNREAGRDGVLGYYRGLANAFTARGVALKDARLSRMIVEYERCVRDLEEAVGSRGRWPLAQ